MSQYYYNPFENENNAQVNQMMIRRQREYEEKREIRIISATMAVAIIAYLVIQSIEGSVLKMLNLSQMLNDNALFQYSFTIIGVSFLAVAVPFALMALINKKRYTAPVIPNQRIGFFKGLIWVGFGMMCCVGAQFAVSFAASFIENLFKVKLTQGETAKPDSIFACVMVVVGIAIIPAICEEFAMRCCSLQLLRKYGSGFAVCAVSIVFGLLHGNVIQFIFAFLVGLVLGYITVKTNSILPAIFIHGLNNGMSAINYIIVYAADEKSANTVVGALYIFWLVAGALALIYLLIKGELRLKKNNYYENGEPVKVEEGTKSVLTIGQKFLSFLFPWMIFPFFILILLTAFTIKPA